MFFNFFLEKIKGSFIIIKFKIKQLLYNLIVSQKLLKNINFKNEGLMFYFDVQINENLIEKFRVI
jgi:hypothetical protein